MEVRLDFLLLLVKLMEIVACGKQIFLIWPIASSMYDRGGM